MPQESGSVEWAGLRAQAMFYWLHAPHCRLQEKCMRPLKRQIRFEAGPLHGSTFLRHMISVLFTV